MYNSLSLFPFCSLCIPNIAVYVIPNCWQLAEVGNTLLAVVKRWFVLYLSYMVFFFFPLRIYPKLSPSLSYLCFAWSCYLGCHACGCANHTLWLSLPVNFCSAMSKPKNKKPTNQPTSLQDLQLAYSSFWKACLSEINWIIAVGRSDCAWRWKLQRKVICGDDHSFNDISWVAHPVTSCRVWQCMHWYICVHFSSPTPVENFTVLLYDMMGNVELMAVCCNVSAVGSWYILWDTYRIRTGERIELVDLAPASVCSSTCLCDRRIIDS